MSSRLGIRARSARGSGTNGSRPAIALHAGRSLPRFDGHGLANLPATIVQTLGGTTRSLLPPVDPSVFPRALAAGVEAAVVLLADGLGDQQLKRAITQGDAPAMADLCARASRKAAGGAGVAKGVLTSVFPSSTVPALTTLSTGVAPGVHGVLGWITHLEELGGPTLMVKWGPATRPNTSYADVELGAHDPLKFLGVPTIHQRLAHAGARSEVLVPAAYAGSSFTRMLYAGARMTHYKTMREVVPMARDILRGRRRGERLLVMLYIPNIDEKAHAHGPLSPQHAQEVRKVDTIVGGLAEAVREDGAALLLVTADHGHVDGGSGRFTDLTGQSDLVGLLDTPPTGERRVTYLHPRPGQKDRVRAALTQILDGSVDLVTPTQLAELGLLGPLFSPRARRRAGALVAIARGSNQQVYLFDRKIKPRLQAGDHGGLESSEMMIPLLAVTSRA